jgi:hypothetical protein
MNKTFESDQIFTKRSVVLLVIATVLLPVPMLLKSENTPVDLLVGLFMGTTCCLWWALAVWWLGKPLARRHVVIVVLYDVVAIALPAIFALAFLYAKMAAVVTGQGDRSGAFWLGVTLVSGVSAGAALFGRAINSH